MQREIEKQILLYSTFSLFFAFLCFFAPLRQQFFMLRNMIWVVSNWEDELIVKSGTLLAEEQRKSGIMLLSFLIRNISVWVHFI